MIGLDTNVLVRYVMQDDPRQSPKATRLMESLTSESPGFVSQISIVEFVWVLSSSYELTRAQVASALDLLLRGKELVIGGADQVARQFVARRQHPDELDNRYLGHEAG